jgi:hypothetical protein
MASRYLNHSYTSFMSNLENTCISDYFQIQHYTCTLLRLSESDFTFTIYCEKMKNYAFSQLPIELSIYISNYLYQRINVTYKMVYPITSPFKPPIWSLLYDTSTDYVNYEYISHFLNKQYYLDWTPAISFEKNILNLLECFILLKN